MLLKVQEIRKKYGNKKVLENISFDVSKGNIIGISGENGSGKTTLLNIISGLLKADHGKIIFDCSWGYCPQDIILFDHLTIKEHFNYFKSAYNLKKQDYQKEVEFLMDFFNYKKYENEIVHKLSSGTKQKLNLCLSLLHKPDLLILDEPYSNLDWDTYIKFWDYAKDIKKQNRSILIVSHLFYDKNNIDKIYTIQNGVII